MATRRAAPGWVDRSDIPLTRLHLDPQNPRHDAIADENEIIAHLYRQERVLGMAKNIAKLGAISPMERIGVIEMPDNPGHFVVVEGNRRACALRLLHDPKKAPTPAARTAMQHLAEASSIPGQVPVVVFKDRPTSKPWIGLRHNGEQAGAGVRKWNSTQKARHDKVDNPNQLALAVLDRAEAGAWVTPQERKQVGLTTLTRYLKNKVIRAMLGLGDARDLEYTHDPAQVDAALQRLVRDALPPANKNQEPEVNSRTNISDRLAYVRKLQAAGVTPRTPLAEAVRPPPVARVLPGKRRSARNPANRPRVVPSDFVVKNRDPALLRVLNELRVDTVDHEFTVNFLLRAFIERVLVLYAKKHGFHQPGLPDHMLVKKCTEHLEANGVHENETKNMRTAASNKDVPFSLHTLGAAVHGGHTPFPKTLNAVWENWAPALTLMLDRI